MARDSMTLEEVIMFTKQALENVNSDKRVSTEFRFAAWQVKRLLVWLEDYKRLKDEMIPAYDEQLTEAQRKVVQQMREMKQLKADYIDIDKQLRKANTENDELKRLLRLAVDDFDKLANVESCCYPFCDERCPFYCAGGCEEKEWKHRDEAMKLLGGNENDND